ncbi:hypothetical protein ACIQUG_21590 [Ensifer sp. NPDC090286]|uniref:hypothetical protein n=1 Tax=Ensifer sp. NPDC090286 TaxID=3363991 RepID=UPI00383B118D
MQSPAKGGRLCLHHSFGIQAALSAIRQIVWIVVVCIEPLVRDLDFLVLDRFFVFVGIGNGLSRFRQIVLAKRAIFGDFTEPIAFSIAYHGLVSAFPIATARTAPGTARAALAAPRTRTLVGATLAAAGFAFVIVLVALLASLALLFAATTMAALIWHCVSPWFVLLSRSD